ncbi:tetratricopeptide repeat protein [Fusobacterium animalis]
MKLLSIQILLVYYNKKNYYKAINTLKYSSSFIITLKKGFVP